MNRIGSLCSGYEGLGMAVEAVLGGELAWVADNDPGAAKVLAHRFPSVPNLGDITAVDWGSVEPVDVLTAGFPCQDISCAGKRAGLRKGTRSGLWYHVARAIDELRPPVVVIENVKELLSERADSDMERCPWCMGDRGDEPDMRALGAVLADLAALGFDAEWVSFPAASIGACHLRWRVFILAWPAANTDSARRRQVAGGASGDEGTAAGWAALHDHEPVGPRADLAANTARIGPGKPADETLTVAGSRGPRPVPGGRGVRTPADASRDGWNEGRPESARLVGRPDAAVGVHAPAAYAECDAGDGRTDEPVGEPDWRTAAFWNRPGAFGRYEAAIRQHERAFGRRAPAPVEPGRNGDPRLAPRFVEWMQGLPKGWVTDIPGLSRNAQLKALGNGVVPQQAAMALRVLLARAWPLEHMTTEGAA